MTSTTRDSEPPAAYRLGEFRVEPALNRLVREGRTTRLEPSSMDVLVHLIERSPEVVPAAELLERFWSDTFAEESRIHRQINQIRKALGDSARRPIYIETVPKRGYRIVAEVGRADAPSEPGESLDAAVEAPIETRRARPALAIAATAVLALALVAGYLLRSGGSTGDENHAATEVRPPRIAVLPFASFSSQEDDAYLAAGFHEDVIAKLAGLDGLEVISRTSVSRYGENDGSATLPEIAAELGVSHVLEGSVRRDGQRLRIALQLIDAESDVHLWSHTYDEELSDLFAIQSDVAEQVAERLSIALPSEDELALDPTPTHDLDAYDMVLRARAAVLAGNNMRNLRQAEALFEEARRRDLDLAAAHAGLAEVLFLETFSGAEWGDVRERALSAIERALELDPESAIAHLVDARLAETWEEDLEAAARHYERALELGPRNTYVLTHYGAFLAATERRPADALPYLRRALDLDPLSGEIHFYLGRTLMDSGDLEGASAIVERGLRYEPDHRELIGLDSSIRFARGDLRGYLHRTVDEIRLDPYHSENLASVAYVLAVLGEPDAAARWVARMRAAAPTHPEVFGAERMLAFVRRDPARLEALAARWDAINSQERLDRRHDGVVTPFAPATRALALTLRADEAHAAGRNDEEQALRGSAVERGSTALLDDRGEAALSSRNLPLALCQAENLILLGRAEEAETVLRALVSYQDFYNEATPTLLRARALLGETEEALQYAESRPASLIQSASLESVKENRLGLYDELASSPRFASLYDEAQARIRTLDDDLRREFPGLLDATIGL